MRIANLILQRNHASVTRAIQLAPAGRSRRRCHTRRSIHRVGPRHNKYSGLITSNVINTAIAMSPRTATAGETRPRIVKSVRIRPMWMANSVAMKASVQVRSIGARTRSSASIWVATATASGSSVSPSSLTTVSSASVVP
jgi:hypothetical protein